MSALEIYVVVYRDADGDISVAVVQTGSQKEAVRHVLKGEYFSDILAVTTWTTSAGQIGAPLNPVKVTPVVTPETTIYIGDDYLKGLT